MIRTLALERQMQTTDPLRHCCVGLVTLFLLAKVPVRYKLCFTLYIKFNKHVYASLFLRVGVSI
jgi:hypothetical protein